MRHMFGRVMDFCRAFRTVSATMKVTPLGDTGIFFEDVIEHPLRGRGVVARAHLNELGEVYVLFEDGSHRWVDIDDLKLVGTAY